MLKTNPVYKKSFNFAIRIVNLYKHLKNTKKENVLSKQLLRSGTSIGANVAEGIQAQTKNDFLSKMNIALKEANETSYWIDLLYATNYLTDKEHSSLNSDLSEILKLLISIVKTSKNSLNKNSKN
jgi:four helix bundle protein